MERHTLTPIFAQAVKAPTNGASNSEDFQPPTRNPQSTDNLQQGAAQTQTAGGQDLLTNPNANITITRNPAEANGATTAARPNGMNWGLILFVSVIIVVIVELWFRRRDRKTSLINVATASTEALEEEVTVATPKLTDPQPSKPKVKSSSKKKSKSKRKHK